MGAWIHLVLLRNNGQLFRKASTYLIQTYLISVEYGSIRSLMCNTRSVYQFRSLCKKYQRDILDT